jgi:hypothetical protein
VARIRSIKPEFWKSETIAALPIRTRLTFIGLWSYVDDNGVGIDSFKLIAAELYGLEDDPREARDNTRECLARLADARLITRYTLDGKRYIRITNWDEHQRIDRPNKPRYPLPTDPTVTLLDPAQAAEMDSGAQVKVDDSRNTRATLASVHRLEQWNKGAGEQGIIPPPAAAEAAPSTDLARLDDSAPVVVDPETTQDLIGYWISNCRERPPGQLIGQMSKTIKRLADEDHIAPEHIRAGIDDFLTKDLSPSLLPSLVNTAMNRRPAAPKQSTRDERVMGWLNLEIPGQEAYA